MGKKSTFKLSQEKKIKNKPLKQKSLKKKSLKEKERAKVKTAAKKEKFVSIKVSIITMCICFAIIPLLIVNIISTKTSKEVVRETTQQLSEEIIKQVSENMTVFNTQVEIGRASCRERVYVLV